MASLTQLNAIESAALLADHLARVGQISVEDAARLTGLSLARAAKLIDQISRALPVYEDSDGIFHRLPRWD